MPRNRELMRIFRDLEFVEHLGSGMNRILRAYDKSIFHLSENFVEIVFPYEEEYLRLAEQVTEQVTEQVAMDVTLQDTIQVADQVKRLITVISNYELSIKEIMEKLSLKHRPTLVYDYIRPALALALIELTQPDSPNSPTQKYRLTNKGMEIKKQLGSLHYEK